MGCEVWFLGSEVGCCDIKSSRVQLGFRQCDGVLMRGSMDMRIQGRYSHGAGRELWGRGMRGRDVVILLRERVI
jgi:hypothetical protein